MLTFYGGETAGIGINITGNDTYYEIKDGYFYGFSKGVVVSSSADLWLFETDFDSCLTAGVEIDAGTTGNASFRSSECDYYNCAVGLNLISAGVNTEVAIINGTFYNTSGSQTGIKYLPTTGNNNFRFQSMIIQNNSYNNIGSFYSGFDFSRSDGRDAEVFFENNAGKESAAPHCKFNVTNNTSETTIINANTWYKAANFNSYNSYTTKWTITNNRIKYQSANSRDAISMISGNIRCNSSQARTINIAVVKNGASGTRYGETTVRIPSNNANQSFQFSTNVYLQDVSKDDYFEIWLTSGNSGDVLVIDDLNWFTQTF